MKNKKLKHLLIILSFLLLSSPVIGQSERPETIIVPVSSMGDVSDTRKQILQNTLTDELKKYFRIVPQEKYEQVLEQVFAELEYEECSEDTCIMRVQEMLQVENVFNLQIIGEGKDSQLNLKWITLDEKKNETDVCLGCGTFQLNDKVRELVKKLVGDIVVEKSIQDEKEEELKRQKEDLKKLKQTDVKEVYQNIVFKKEISLWTTVAGGMTILFLGLEAFVPACPDYSEKGYTDEWECKYAENPGTEILNSLAWISLIGGGIMWGYYSSELNKYDDLKITYSPKYNSTNLYFVFKF